jgi:flagellar motor switch protein FliN/FliY
MSDRIELEQLTPTDTVPDADSVPLPVRDLKRLSEVPVEVTVEMGRTRMTVGETLELHQGSIIPLNRMAGEPVDLLVNGTLIAHGEVVVIDEQFGLRVTDVLGESAPAEPVRLPPLEPEPEPEPEPVAVAS